MFDVNRMMMDDVQIDEMSARAHYNKMVAQGKVGRGGRLVTPIDRKRFPNREREGLEGPFRSRKSGQVYYYDKKAGKYYDPLSDMYLQVKDVMETRVTDNLNDYVNLHETQINEEFGPETYESAKGSIEAILYMYKNPKFDPKVYFANNENGQLFVSLYDYNGDGLVDYDDLTFLLSLESAGLPFMYAFTYNKYMDSDARSGVKQQMGSQLQIGKTMGSKMSKPPAAPPTTGNMREGVQLDEEDRDPRFASQLNAIQLFMQTVIDNPEFDFESFYQDETGQYFLSLYDYNGDGVIDFGDLQVLLSLEGAGLPYMDAADYIRYMGSDARSGAKQQRGTQMQIGKTMGSMTSKPPAAPPDMSTGAGGR